MSTTPATPPSEEQRQQQYLLRVDLQRALEDCIVIDIETTGLRPQEERIFEIAALRISDGVLRERFTSLLNPQRAVPEEITDLTGISDGLLADKPTFSDILPDLLEFLHPVPVRSQRASPRLVGHNVSFDFSFLTHEILRTQLASAEDMTDVGPYTPRLVCTAEASRALIPREAVGRYRLGNVARYLQVPHRPLHRAMSDALATYDVLRALTAQ